VISPHCGGFNSHPRLSGMNPHTARAPFKSIRLKTYQKLVIEDIRAKNKADFRFQLGDIKGKRLKS